MPTGDLDRAEALYHEGLHELPHSEEYVLDRASCYLRGSEVAYRNGNSREALLRARDAERTLKKSSIEWNLQELNVLINLAGVLGDARQFREADEIFEQASALMTSLGYDGTQKAVKLYNDWALILTYAGRQLQAERPIAAQLTSVGQTRLSIQSHRFCSTTMPQCFATWVEPRKEPTTLSTPLRKRNTSAIQCLWIERLS